MGGPSKSTEAQQQQITSQQLQLSEQQQELQAENYKRMTDLEAPQISFLQGIAGGDSTKTMQTAAPLISNISSGYNAAKESIMNSIPAGAARDYALSQLPVQQNNAVASTLNSTFLSSLDKLTNIGAGLGSFSLQELGAAFSGLSGASSSNQALGQMQAASSPWNFLGSIFGTLGGAAGQIFQGKCWIAEAIYGADDPRTHLVRAWINGPFQKTPFGFVVGIVYGVVGRQVAWVARRSTIVRRALQPLFDRALERALDLEPVIYA